MDQYLNDRHKEVLYSLLANPADTGQLYASNLQSLVNEFPQSGLLNALLAHAEGGQHISQAASYFDNKALFKLINAPEILAEVTAGQIINKTNGFNGSAVHYENTSLPSVEPEETLQHYSDETPRLAEEIESDQSEVIEEDANVSIPNEELIPVEQATETAYYFSGEPEITAGIAEDEQLIEAESEPAGQMETLAVQDTDPYGILDSAAENEDVLDNVVKEIGVKEKQELPVFTIDEHENVANDAIDDEVFDEIVAIEDIRFAEINPNIEPLPLEIAAANVGPETVINLSDGNPVKDRALDLNDETEKLIVGNIAATDYFVFDRAMSDRKQNETADAGSRPMPAEVKPEQVIALPNIAEKQDVSKYHDEKMPYTFMWWLDKTRKEHSDMYQPYIKPGTEAVSKPDELQQQYFENIFHLSSVDELDRSTPQQTVEFDMKRKEDAIIQRFIHEEPHIKPPSNEKLDNENKAKRSAEDQDELVTETLARIYTDQMLYHKAINTYKKLVLKFPEKSRYFADQIEQLQRKIN